jgi:hypothetical protein
LLKIDIYFYFWHWPACYDSWTQYLTVTVVKAPKHIVDRNINSIPQRGRFSVSSSAVMYLKKEEMFKNHIYNNNTNFDLVNFYDRTAVSAVVKLFCIRRNDSSETLGCSCISDCCISFPQCCTDMTCVCLISKRTNLSFSSWLQTTHTIVAYRLLKPIYKHTVKTLLWPVKMEDLS